MIKVQVDETITLSVVQKLISQYHSSDICIVIENTKKQNASYLEEIAKKYPNIIISVTGGLNPKKNKFNDEYYQKRTYYNPLELSKIINIFNAIERKMNLSWTDTQKVMFYYQELCNYMEYSECSPNGRDVSRNLAGLLYRKAVCSGFAMIFKEALDRLGIKNIYQNKESYHSWNIAYVDGHYRAFELTWECYHSKQKQGGVCKFVYFNRDEDFYRNEHHNLKYEKEESEYPIVPYTYEELIHDLKVIKSKKVKAIQLNNSSDTTVNIMQASYTIKKVPGGVDVLGPGVKTFIREDGTKFSLLYVGQVKKLNKFVYFDLSSQNMVKATSIFSEVRLDDVDSQYNYTIANKLLSKERIFRKVNGFNGYVGYIGKSHSIYYSDKIETETLNIIR